MTEATVFIPHFGRFEYSQEQGFYENEIRKKIHPDLLINDVISVSTFNDGLSYLPNNRTMFREDKLAELSKCDGILIIYGGCQICWFSNIITTLTKYTTIANESRAGIDKVLASSDRKRSFYITCLRLSQENGELQDELDEIILQSIRSFTDAAEYLYNFIMLVPTDEYFSQKAYIGPIRWQINPKLESVVAKIGAFLNFLTGKTPQEKAKDNKAIASQLDGLVDKSDMGENR